MSQKTMSIDAAMKAFRPLMKAAENTLHTRFDEAAVAQIVPAIEGEFRSLAPDIPYVGGNRNPFSGLIVNAAGILAMYRVLEKHGMSLDDFDGFLKDLTIRYVHTYPGWLRKIMGRMWMSRLFQRILHKRAVLSQQRLYPDDFVFEVVPGNGDFKWGINYLECGIAKYLHKHGEKELAKCACTLDYVMFPALGVSLERTETIAEGCDKCDFRFGGQV